MRIIYLHCASNNLESTMIASEMDLQVRGHQLFIQWTKVTNSPKKDEHAIPVGTVKIYSESQTDEYICAEFSRISKFTIERSDLRPYYTLKEKEEPC